MKTVMTVDVRGRGKTRGAFGFALIFLLHFLHQGKKWKTNYHEVLKKFKETTVRCRVKPGMTVYELL